MLNNVYIHTHKTKHNKTTQIQCIFNNKTTFLKYTHQLLHKIGLKKENET